MDELLTMDYEISWVTLILVFLFTFGIFYPIIRLSKTPLKKTFILLFVLSFFIYSGIGISILEDKVTYLFFYTIYLLVLVASFFLFRNKTIKFSLPDEKIDSTINKYGLYVIMIYNLIYFSLLLFPKFELKNLISPPSVDASSMMDVIQGKSEDVSLTVANTFLNILVPIYYMSLLRYKNKPLKMLFFLILPLYLSYCHVAYIARTTMVLTFVLYASLLYYYNERYRKLIVISGLTFFIFSISFLTTYQALRMGVEVTSIPISDAIDGLFRIECTFPTWFKTIYKHSLTNQVFIAQYLGWFFTQPIPGFLKSWLVTFNQNVTIAELLLGMRRNQSTEFFVPLTGLIGESVFVFGRYLFFIHAIILGAVMNIFINFLESKSSFKVLTIYSVIFIGLAIGRTGSTGGMVYPYMIKTLFYVPVILFLLNLKFKK